MARESALDFHEHRPWSMPMEGARRAAFERFHGPSRWPTWMLDAAKTRERTAVPEGIDALAEIKLPDQDGQPIRLRDLWRDGPVAIVWLRQFGCPFCRAYAVELNRARNRFTDAGVRLVLIGRGIPEDARRFRRHIGIDLPVFTDIDRVTYLWAGTKLATLDELVGPPVVVRALVRMARRRVFIGHNTADEARLGGSIAVMPDGRVPFVHISRDASDVASPTRILAAVGAIQVGPDGRVHMKREQADQANGLAGGSEATAATAAKEEWRCRSFVGRFSSEQQSLRCWSPRFP